MTGLSQQSPQHEAWQRALRDIRALAGSAGMLQSDRPAAISMLSGALYGGGERTAALRLLCFLDTDYTLALVDSLVPVALCQADTLFVRQALGRLPFDEAARTVPPAVWRQLDETDDDDAYRRLAELLRYLGLTAALQQLCERALDSDDPAVREVSENFAC
jgi:hypothetical protein